MFVQTDDDHMTMHHISAYDVTCSQLATPSANTSSSATSTPPLFRGMWVSINREFGVKKCEGGPRKWEAQAVCYENGQHLLLSVFSHSFFLHLPLTPITPRLLPPPPLSHPNASWRWLLLLFWPDSYHHHLPCIQTWAGGGFFSLFQCNSHHHHLFHIQTWAEAGFFCSFDLTSTTTTTLRSKCFDQL